MTIKIGDTLPSTTFVQMTDDGPEQIKSDDFFAGRTIALFSVPGAFTPTCSVKHLPSFVDKVDDLKTKGVDEVACTSVTDVFVLDAWAKASDAKGKITMLADGNGEFAKATELEFDGAKFGMGKRGQRFSMLVENGMVTQLNVEQPGGYEVSSAEYLLGQL